MKIRTLYLILGAIFLGVIVALADSSFRSYSEIQRYREVIVTGEIATSRALLEAIREEVIHEDWNTAGALLTDLLSVTRSQQIAIIESDGSIPVRVYTQLDLEPPSPDFIERSLKNPEWVVWDFQQDTAWIGVSFIPTLSSQPVVLARQVNRSQSLEMLRATHRRNILLSLLTSIFIGIVIYAIVRIIGTRPLERLEALATAVQQGDLKIRVPPLPLYELDRLGNVFNQMLDRIQSQHEQLTQINQNLELAVQASVASLQEVNEQLSHRAEQLESLNTLTGIATSSLNLQELSEKAIQWIVELFNAQMGWIEIFETSRLYHVPEELKQYLIAHESALESLRYQSGLISDWGQINPENPLYELRDTLAKYGIISTMSALIPSQDEIIGRVIISHTQADFWREQDLAILQIAAAHLGQVAQRIRYDEQILESNRLLSLLVEYTRTINRQLHTPQIYRTILNEAINLTHASAGAMLKFRNGEAVCLSHWGISHSATQNQLPALLGNKFSLEKIPPNGYAEIFLHPEKGSPLAEFRHAMVWNVHLDPENPILLISLYSESPPRISAAVRDVMQAFARHTGTILENVHLFEAEREQRAIATALRDVSEALTSTLDLDQVFDRILLHLEKILDHDAANIMMLEGDTLVMVRNRGISTGYLSPRPNWRSPLTAFRTLQEVAQSAKALAIPDTQHDTRWVSLPTSGWIRSFASAPILLHDQVVGFINVGSKRKGQFDQKTAALLQSFATQASIAIENAQLYTRAQQTLMENSTLFRALESLFSGGESLDEILEKIVATVVNEFSQSHCSILLVNEDQSHLMLAREAGMITLGYHHLPLNGKGLTVACFRSGRMVYAPDVKAEPDYYEAIPAIQSELVLPLVARGEVIGVLNLESPHLDAFDERSRRLLSMFADRAALVISNALFHEKTRRYAHQMALLNEIIQISLSHSRFEDMLSAIVERVAALVSADGCYITRFDEESLSVIPVVAFGPGSEAYTTIHPEPGEPNLTLALMREGKPIAIEDTLKTSYISRQVAETFPVRSLLGIPLIIENQKFGAILFGNKEVYRWSASQIALAEQAASQITLILARLQSQRLAEQQAQESEKLRRVTAALTTTLDKTELSRMILEHLESLFECDSSILFLIESEGMKPIACRNIPEGEEMLSRVYPLSDALFQEILQTAQPVLLRDAQSDPRFENWGGTDQIRSWMGVPLFAGDRILGTIAIGRFKIRPFTHREQLLAQVYANQAGMALQNAMLHAYQQVLAITDPLTNLYNRRGFYELARHEMERSRRFGSPLVVVMADIDHFKQVNDQYGHSVGDQVLQELAHRLRETLREADLICRYGGEEFCLLLPESDLQSGYSAAERVRLAIAETPFPIEEHLIPITISLGVSRLESPQQTLEELIEQADQALLHAKAFGRNRVEIWQQDLLPS
ncbi:MULTISPECIES: GAF domain-containing protein [Anaerolinea]|uniref:GAF domain-containing protein n=1 Tax=Anaerolinea TaxID=233189 RepID=UPI0026252A95|nr:GAF domain-containing protein [Anaerolinea thermophila]